MSHLTRKDFLRLTSWSLAATLLPIEKIEAFTSLVSAKGAGSISDFEQAIELAREARSKFHLKHYEDAAALYKQCIALAPRAICFYDGLDNVYGAQSLYLESIMLYKEGLAANPDVIAFYDRAARSLYRLETGDDKHAFEYRRSINSVSLLTDAKILYEQAITIQDKPYLHVGLDKVLYRLNIAPLVPGFKVNRVFKNQHNVNRNTYKTTLNAMSSDKIREMIARIDLKPRRDLYTLEDIQRREINKTIQKKKFYDILRKRDETPVEIRLDDVKKLMEVDLTDPNSLKKVKTLYYSNNKFFDFIDVRKQFADASKTVYSYMGVMDAMEIAYKKGQVSSDILNEAIGIGNNLMTWQLLTHNQVDLAVKMAKILMLQDKADSANAIIEEMIQRMDVETISLNNRLIHYYAKIHYLKGEFEFAKRVLLIGLKELDEPTMDKYIIEYPKLDIVKRRVEGRKYFKFKDNLSLYYLLYECYVSLEQTDESVEVINRLIENNPNDSFVLTRN